jgi:hypothetical protein
MRELWDVVDYHDKIGFVTLVNNVPWNTVSEKVRVAKNDTF